MIMQLNMISKIILKKKYNNLNIKTVILLLGEEGKQQV